MSIDYGALAGTALNMYTGGASGAALSGAGQKSGGASPGSAAQIVPNQTAEQKSSQTVNTTVTVGDGGGDLAALLPLLLSNQAGFSTVQGYSAESVLSGRAGIGTYAVVGLLGLLGVVLFRKL